MDSLQITEEEALTLLKSKKKGGKGKPPDKSFEPRWVKLPMLWIKALRQAKSVSTVSLAHAILSLALMQEWNGREIVLSAQSTGVPKSTRARAVDELVRLKLIKIKRSG